MSDSIQEEWLKLVISELRKNNDKLDELKDDISDKFSDIEKSLSAVTIKVSELNVHVDDTRNDVKDIEYTLKGNGSPGLKTKVELLEREINNIKSKVDSINFNKLDENKAIRAAIIGGAGSGVMALAKIIVDFFKN